ncbi:RICIN domain-containing protein [Bradyrhizobium neotropicale]|uniref:RICIN domain-containing protein n=1 Tax=Bradyrhizobium neotropicale TaxID=1497615 RepID=UPI001AD6B279|nr:RICIN domain-containing protein [Bradyrhizobium neotropicale]MBO4228499.1 hypothetical protein [Bradyrhizobium neotropicale]
MGIYIIEYRQDPNFVLGVKDQQLDSPVVLRKKGTPNRYVLWDVSYDTSAITLNSSGGKLAIGPQGDRVAPEVLLSLKVYNPADAKQQWELLKSPGFILNDVNEQLCVDNKNRVTSDGNPTWLYQFNGSVAQQWNFVPLSTLRVAE